MFFSTNWIQDKNDKKTIVDIFTDFRVSTSTKDSSHINTIDFEPRSFGESQMIL